MDTGYRANPEAFKRQMETFDRMRETQLAYYRQQREAKHRAGYPKGEIDLRRLTGRDLPSVEPGRVYR